MSKGKRNTIKRKRTPKEEVIQNQSPMSILKVTLIVLAFLGLFYLLTLYLTNQNHSKSEETDSSSSVTDSTSISIGKSLSMDVEEYFVLFYDKTNSDISSIYSSLVLNYSVLENALPIYTVDMGSAFHQSFVSEESNPNPESEEELKINGPTLIKVTNGKVEGYYEGEESIREVLK